MATYSYKISDLSNGYEATQLCKEINMVHMIFQYVLFITGDSESDLLAITFENLLPDEEKRVLDEIVANHNPKKEHPLGVNFNIDMMDRLVRNLGTAILGTDAVNKDYVDKAISDIDMNGLNLNELRDFQNSIGRDIIKIDSHILDTSNPHHITKKQIGLGNVMDTKHNLTATIKPGKLDDIISGYSKGSIWLNNTTGKTYICVDSAEMNAIWTEITSQGEKILIHNEGDGEGIFSHKNDSNVHLKSIKGSDNVVVESDSSSVIIKSKDSHSFLLSAFTIEVIDSQYDTDLLKLPWMHSEFQNLQNGKIIFETVIPATNPMSVRILNKTQNSILSELTDISSSGMYQMSIANPSADARIVIQVKKNDPNGLNPMIHGIILRYES